MNIKIINQTKKMWTSPPENWEKVLSLWKNNQSITFYSWECPPRQVYSNRKYGKFVNFDIDIKAVVWGKKLDKYTEIPRINTRMKDEKWFIKNIVLKNPKTTYIKLIADTNAIYLFPKSLKILGKEKNTNLSYEFQRQLKLFSKLMIGKKFPRFTLFTKIQKKYLEEYETFFNLVYQSFNQNLSSSYVRKDIIDYWKIQLSEHIGLTQRLTKEKMDLLKRIIASYAAEGMIFALASKEGVLPNPVWVNWEEPPPSGKNTEILRSRYGIEPIPKIYLLK